MSNNSYVESSIINKFDYNSQNSFTKVDTVLLGDYLKLDISAEIRTDEIQSDLY